MPIKGIQQPDFIHVDHTTRLRRYDGQCEFALEWYEDEETLLLVNNSKKPYDLARIKKMYNYLDSVGEEYFIEVLVDGEYLPIGDVTFSELDMPIVIGNKAYRGKGIGKKVIITLVKRARELGFSELKINEIYKFNIGSQQLFTSCGFEPYEETDTGFKYHLAL